MAGTLEAMDKTKFNQNVEALAKKHPGRYWSENMQKQLNFDRVEVEVGQYLSFILVN